MRALTRRVARLERLAAAAGRGDGRGPGSDHRGSDGFTLLERIAAWNAYAEGTGPKPPDRTDYVPDPAAVARMEEIFSDEGFLERIAAWEGWGADEVSIPE
jgi:hypothetical protein